VSPLTTAPAVIKSVGTVVWSALDAVGLVDPWMRRAWPTLDANDARAHG